jgi:hypothetical protein
VKLGRQLLGRYFLKEQSFLALGHQHKLVARHRVYPQLKYSKSQLKSPTRAVKVNLQGRCTQVIIVKN